MFFAFGVSFTWPGLLPGLSVVSEIYCEQSWHREIKHLEKIMQFC